MVIESIIEKESRNFPINERKKALTENNEGGISSSFLPLASLSIQVSWNHLSRFICICVASD
jgi:hypothetical protein